MVHAYFQPLNYNTKFVKNDHLYEGTGNPWAGQTMVKLIPLAVNIVLDVSPLVILGTVLDTGSNTHKHYPKPIF